MWGLEERREGEGGRAEGGREGELVKGKKVDLVLKKMVRQRGSSLRRGRGGVEGGGLERGKAETGNNKNGLFVKNKHMKRISKEQHESVLLDENINF